MWIGRAPPRRPNPGRRRRHPAPPPCWRALLVVLALPTALAAPDTPTLSSCEAGDGSAALAWADVSATSYAVTVDGVTTTTTATTASVSGLVNWQTYEIGVVASDADGDSPTATCSVTPEPPLECGESDLLGILNLTSLELDCSTCNAYLRDFDLDGDRDVLVFGEAFFWNTGSDAAPVLERDDAAADLGNMSAAALTGVELHDWDGDGDVELFGYYYSYPSQHRLVLENVGSPQRMLWEATGDITLGGYSGQAAASAFGDFDLDGDLDMFSKQRWNGGTWYQNQGSDAAPSFASVGDGAEEFGGEDVVVGAYSTIVGCDVDNDGDTDVVTVSAGIAYTFFDVGTGATRDFEPAVAVSAASLTTTGTYACANNWFGFDTLMTSGSTLSVCARRPDDVVITGVTPLVSGSVLLEWAEPTVRGGGRITAYTIHRDSDNVKTVVAGEDCCSYLFEDLEAFEDETDVGFAIVAHSFMPDTVQPAYTDAVTVLTATVSAPTNVSCIGGDYRVTVSWSAPDTNVGSAITAYTVSESVAGQTVQVDGSTYSVTISGLAAWTTVDVSVAAVNAEREGYSASCSATRTVEYSLFAERERTHLLPDFAVTFADVRPAYGDVSGDGEPDVLVVGADGAAVVRLGPDFATEGAVPAGLPVLGDQAIALLDVTLDGTPELLVGGDVYDLATGFTGTTLPGALPAVGADLDGDGFGDVVMLNATGGASAYMSGSGFATPVGGWGDSWGAEVTGAMLFDTDGDGVAELHVVPPSSGDDLWAGATLLSPSTLAAIGSSQGALVGSPGSLQWFPWTGHADGFSAAPVAVAEPGFVNVSWVAAEDHGAVITRYTLSSGDTTDGQLWIALPGLPAEATSFIVTATNAAGDGYPSPESNAVTPAPPIEPPSAPSAVSCVAGDNVLNVSFVSSAVASSATSFLVTLGDQTMSVGPTERTASFATPNGLAVNASVAAVNDVGASAAVTCNSTTPAVARVFVEAAELPAWAPSESVNGRGLALADVDGDDVNEVFVCTLADGVRVWSLGVEDASLLSAVSAPVNCSVGAGDYDGDGDTDLLVGDADGTVLLWRNQGTATIPTFNTEVTLAAAAVGRLAAPAFVPGEGLYVGCDGGEVAFVDTATGERAAQSPLPLVDARGVIPAYEPAEQQLELAIDGDDDDCVAMGFALDGALCRQHSGAWTWFDRAGRPDRVSTVTRLQDDFGGARLAWGAPADNGLPIESFTVQSTPALGAAITVDTPELRFPDLAVDTSYTFSIVATNAAGQSDRFETAALFIEPQPSAPLNLTCWAGDNTVNVSWAAPAFDGGVPPGVLGYVVELDTEDGYSTRTTALSVEFHNVTNWAALTASVAAVNSERTGVWAACDVQRVVPYSRFARRDMPADFARTQSQVAPTLGDVDGDGAADLVVGSYDGLVEWYDLDTLELQGTIVTAPSTSASPAMGDTDGDGDEDLVVCTLSGVWWYAGPLFDDDPVQLAASPQSAGCALGDLDGDGLADLVVNDQAAGFSLPSRPGARPALCDFDGDGDADLLLDTEAFENVDGNGTFVALTDGVWVNDEPPDVIDLSLGCRGRVLFAGGTGSLTRWEFAAHADATAAPLAVESDGFVNVSWAAPANDFGAAPESYSVAGWSVDADQTYMTLPYGATTDSTFAVTVTNAVGDSLPSARSAAPVSLAVATTPPATPTAVWCEPFDYGLSVTFEYAGGSATYFTVNDVVVPWNERSASLSDLTNGVALLVNVTAHNDAGASAPAEAWCTPMVPRALYVVDEWTNLDGSMTSPATVDIDDDGDLDLFVGLRDNDAMRFFRQTSDGQWTEDTCPLTVATSASRVVPAFTDYDDDGDQDAVWGDFSGGVSTADNVGTPAAAVFVSAVDAAALDVGYWPAPCTGDLDGDGVDEIVMGSAGGALDVFRGDDFSRVSKSWFGDWTPLRYQRLTPALCDLDLDGDLDLLIGTLYSGLLVSENENGVFAAPVDSGLGLEGYTSIAPACSGDRQVVIGVQDPADTLVWLTMAGHPDEVDGSAIQAEAGHGYADLAWAPPAEDNGAAVTQYRVHATPDGVAPDQLASADATLRFTGLPAYVSVGFDVTAINEAGEALAVDGPSGVVALLTPGAVTDLVCIGDDHSVTATWSAPTDNVGSAVTAYLVNGELQTETSLTVEGLTAWDAFNVSVVAINAEGTSPINSTCTATREVPYERFEPRRVLPLLLADSQPTLLADDVLAVGGSLYSWSGEMLGAWPFAAAADEHVAVDRDDGATELLGCGPGCHVVSLGNGSVLHSNSSLTVVDGSTVLDVGGGVATAAQDVDGDGYLDLHVVFEAAVRVYFGPEWTTWSDDYWAALEGLRPIVTASLEQPRVCVVGTAGLLVEYELAAHADGTLEPPVVSATSNVSWTAASFARDFGADITQYVVTANYSADFRVATSATSLFVPAAPPGRYAVAAVNAVGESLASPWSESVGGGEAVEIESEPTAAETQCAAGDYHVNVTFSVDAWMSAVELRLEPGGVTQMLDWTTRETTFAGLTNWQTYNVTAGDNVLCAAVTPQPPPTFVDTGAAAPPGVALSTGEFVSGSASDGVQYWSAEAELLGATDEGRTDTVVDAADIDGDGDVDADDVVVGDAAGVVTALGASFQAVVADAWPTLGDVNGDGWPDLLVGGYGGVLALYANTNGTGFVLQSQEQLVGEEHAQPELFDVTGDGLLDRADEVLGTGRGYGAEYVTAAGQVLGAFARASDVTDVVLDSYNEATQTAVVSWSEPAYVGSGVTEYVVTELSTGVSATSTTTRASLGPLTFSSDLVFSVAALTAEGASTSVAATSVLGTIRNLTATPIAGGVNVSWTPIGTWLTDEALSLTVGGISVADVTLSSVVLAAGCESLTFEVTYDLGTGVPVTTTTAAVVPLDVCARVCPTTDGFIDPTRVDPFAVECDGNWTSVHDLTPERVDAVANLATHSLLNTTEVAGVLLHADALRLGVLDTNATRQPAEAVNEPVNVSLAVTMTPNCRAAAVEARVDGADTWVPLAEAVADAGEGDHWLEARATLDWYGVDPTPTLVEWRHDYTAPETSFPTRPPQYSPDLSATFALAASESDVTFTMCFDTTDPAECVQRTSDLDDQDDSDRPETVLESGAVANPTTSPLALELSGGARYELSLDGSAWEFADEQLSLEADEGWHSVLLRAESELGVSDDSPVALGVRVSTVDDEAPDTFLSVAPASVQEALRAQFVANATEPDCTFEWSSDGGATWEVGAAEYEMIAPGDGFYSVLVRATDAAGNVDPTPVWFGWQVAAAPVASWVLTPATPKWPFSMAVFAVRVTGGSSCSMPFELSDGSSGVADDQGVIAVGPLDIGVYTLRVEPECEQAANALEFAWEVIAELSSATLTQSVDAEGAHFASAFAEDAAGNVGPLVWYNWTVDQTPPATVASVAAPLLPAADVDVELGCEDALLGCLVFEWSLDDGVGQVTPMAALTLSNVSDGAHTLRVWAVDLAGNVDASGATVNFTVDTVAPELTAAVNGELVQRVEVTANCTDVTTSCSVAVDPADLAALSDGLHSIVVAATDEAGHATSAEFAVTVDTTPPVTLLVGGLGGTEFFNASTVSVFAAATCTDEHDCEVPEAVVLEGLADGNHTASLAAVDAAGNVDPTPLVYWFVVDTVAPEASITGVAYESSGAGASLALTCIDAWTCAYHGPLVAVDGAVASLTNQTDGYLDVCVYAVDQALHRGPETCTELLFDSTPPVIQTVTVPAAVSAEATADVYFTVIEDNDYVCSCTLLEAPAGSAVSNCAAESLDMTVTLVGDEVLGRLQLACTDVRGHNDSETLEWRVDRAPPLVSVQSVPARVNAWPASLNVTATDWTALTTACWLFRDDVEIASSFACGAETPAQAAEASYMLLAVATDAAGNTAEANASFVLDTTPPVISVVAQPVSVSSTATQEFEVRCVLGANDACAEETVDTDCVFEFEVDGDVFVSADGSWEMTATDARRYEVVARATDQAGNVAEEELSWTYALAPLEPSFAVWPADVIGVLDFELSLEVAGVTDAGVEVRLNGGDWSTAGVTQVSAAGATPTVMAVNVSDMAIDARYTFDARVLGYDDVVTTVWDVEKCADTNEVQYIGDFGELVCAGCRSVSHECALLGEVAEGFWLSPVERFGSPYQCLGEHACPGAAGCRSDEVECDANLCREGYTGVLCGVCADGYATDLKGECHACGDTSGAHVTVALGAVLGVLGLSGAAFIVKRSMDVSSTASAVATLKIILNYAMMMGILKDFELDWGSMVATMYSWIGLAGGGSMTDVKLLNCAFPISPYAEYVAFALVVPGLFAVPGLGILLVTGARRARLAMDGLPQPKNVLVWGVKASFLYRQALMVLSYFAYPIVVTASFRVLHCETVGGQQWLVDDLSEPCAGGKYTAYRDVAVAFMVIVGFGVPLSIGLFMRKHRDELLEGKHRKQFYFFFGEFKHEWYWWEMTVMARKVGLGAISVLLSNDTRGFQVYTGLWMLLVAFVAQLACSPHQDVVRRRLESCALCAVLVSLLLGQPLNFVDLEPWHERVFRGLVIAINLAVMTGMVAVLGHELWLEAKARGLRKDEFVKRISRARQGKPQEAPQQGMHENPMRAPGREFVNPARASVLGEAMMVRVGGARRGSGPGRGGRGRGRGRRHGSTTTALPPMEEGGVEMRAMQV